MKRILLSSLALISTLAFAQVNQKVVSTNVVGIKTSLEVKDQTKVSVVRTDANNRVTGKKGAVGKGASFSKFTLIGQTRNNLQTNGSIYTRVYAYPGNKVSATWTSAQEGPADESVSRGSGYNNFNGTTWGNPTQASLRVESERTGFPCFAYSANTNEEIILSHIVKARGTPNAGAATGLMLNRKTGIGAGTWTGTPVLDSSNILIPGVLWNRSVVSGNYLHVFASFTDSGSAQPNRVFIDGIRAPQVYSRMNLTNNIWEVKKVLLPGYTADRINIGGGDNYAIDAKGSNVAILIGGLTDDLALYKSTDNGNNWTKTIIDSFPVPAFNYKSLVDTSITNDGTVSVVLDNQGNAHCFWAISQVLDDDTTDNRITFFRGLGINQIRYWRDNTSLNSIQVAARGPADTLASGWNAANARYGNLSITTMPHASISNDTIFLIYSAFTEGDNDNLNRNYRDVFLTYSSNNGNSWDTIPANLTQFLGFNQEQIFASISPTSDENIHLVFSQSSSIGNYDLTDNPDAGLVNYDIIYLSVPKASIFDRTVGINTIKNEVFTIVNNYPNPFKGTTNIGVQFNQTTSAVVRVTSVTGQEVFNQTFDKIPAGLNNLELNLGNLNSGIYFYSIEANGFKTTGKMIAE